MQITYEVELDYGDDGPGEGESTPTGDEVAQALRRGLASLGFASVDVAAKQL